MNGPGRPRLGLSLRRDVALPALQLIGAAVVGGGDRPFHPVRLGALGWALLAVGPAALVARRRRPAWLAMGARFAWGTWFSPFAYGTAVPPLNDTLLLAGWLLALVIGAEATRMPGERVAGRSAPRLDRLAELVGSARSAGLSIELEIAGSTRQLPAGVHPAGYRIIQESLTNVARHAGRTRVTVRVTCDDQALLIDVANDGEAASARPAAIGAGSGLAGMRERAAALGGDLSAGFRPGGGFMVSARIPAWSPS